MALTNYTTLKAALADYLIDSTVTNPIVDAITLLEAGLNRDLRVRQMQNISTATSTVSGTASYDFPTGWLEYVQSPHLVQTPIRVLQYVSPSQFRELDDGSGNGTPTYWTELEGKLYVLQTPDTTSVVINQHYYKKLDIATDTTNWLLTNHPDIYLYGSLMHMGAYLTEDQRLKDWAGLYSQALAGLMAADKRRKGGPQPVRVMSDNPGP